MVIKVKEITIGRSRKWAWDFGNSVGFNVSITIEGTTAKDTLEDMSTAGIVAILPLQEKEQERCRDVYDIGQLQEGIEFKEAVESTIKATASGHPVEKLLVKEEKSTNSPMTYFPDLKNCTIMAESESGMAYQVIKDGFYTWLAKSHIDESVMPLQLGILLIDIPLKSARKWILGKDKEGNPKLEWKVVGS